MTSTVRVKKVSRSSNTTLVQMDELTGERLVTRPVLSIGSGLQPDFVSFNEALSGGAYA